MRVRFPSSETSRSARGYVTMLREVKPWGEHGLGFEGTHHKSGSRVDMAALPRPAVLIECAGPVGPRTPPRDYLWVLWRMDFERGDWKEVARAQAPDWTWTIAIRPAAVRELYQGHPPVPDITAVAASILQRLDAALSEMDPAMRPVLLSAIEPQLNGRIASYL